MPFDLASEPSIETRILDEMLEILGPNGERWIKDLEQDDKGGYCMLGALGLVLQRLGFPHGDPITYINQAIYEAYGKVISVVEFSDSPRRRFQEIRRVLRLAKTVTPDPDIMLIAKEASGFLSGPCLKP